MCGSVCWGGRRSTHGVCLGEGDGCVVMVMVSDGVVVVVSVSMVVEVLSVGVVWVVEVTVTLSVMLVWSVSAVSAVWVVMTSIIVVVSVVVRCSVSNGNDGKSYVSCVIVVVFRFFDGFYD